MNFSSSATIGLSRRAKQGKSAQLRSLVVTVFAILPAAVLATVASAQSLSGFTYNGQVYTSYQAGEYQLSPQGLQGTAAIRATGASYGSVVVTQYEQTYTSNTIAPETASSPGYDSSKDPLSPTDAAVVAAIQNMHAQGITVFLKPQVDSLDGTFRGQFAPTNIAAWFASYQAFILHYAQIASQNNVGGLVIGTELASLTRSTYRSYWLNIIAQLRSSYPNLTLAYGANATYSADEFTTMSFWDKVDIIGVDGYFPLTNHANPTVAELVAAWSNNKDGFDIVSALKSLQATYNKPLIFTELGYVSATGTNITPYASAAPGAAYDPTEQNNCYEAFFQVFSQQSSWMKGVFWWAWNVTPPGSTDTGYTPQNKPAANTTLVKWYGSTTPGFTLAPSTSLLTVGQGLQVPATIAVTNLGGFTGSVLLTATGLPSGVTASFVAGTAPGTQVMTLTADTSATAGPFALTITGTSGSLLATTAIQLTVQGATAQTITFANPGAQTVGTPLTLSATASSGLPVSFLSSTLNVCTVANGSAIFSAAGTCSITASQPGNSVYSAAASVTQSFTVSTLAPVPVPAAAKVLVSQVNWLSFLSGNASTSGNPAGGSFATNSRGKVVDANTNNLVLFDQVIGAVTTLGPWSSAGAVAVDAHDNIYVGNLYGPVNSIVKVPYTGASTNGGYAAFTTPTASTPVCTASSTTECALPIPGAVNPGAMTFDAAGNLFFTTAGSGATSGNSIYKCSDACLAGTASPVQIFQEPTAQTAPSPSSGQLLVGGIAVDPTGNVFFTDSSIYVDSSYAITSFFSNLNELPVSSGAGYGGVITGYAATPSVLYTVTPTFVGAFNNQLDAVAVNASTGTVYFGDGSDGVFAFPNTGSAIPTANGQPTALYAVSTQGAKSLTTDGQGNLYFISYSSVINANGGDTVGQIALNNVVVPSSAVGTAVSPSTTLNPVTTLLNGTACSATPAPSVTFSGTSSTATATASTTGNCASTLSGGSSFATSVSFTPAVGGLDTITLSATDQAGNTGSVLVTGTGTQTVSPQTITFAAPPAQTVGTPLTLSATASSGLTITFTSATPAVCTVSGSTATFLKPGTCTIDANQAGNATYSAASQVEQSFQVVAAPSFTLAPSAATLSIAAGASGTETITVAPANGFTGNVALAVSGLPSGVTSSFGNNPTTGTSVLTLTASANAAAATATITITGTSGNLTASSTFTLTITPAPSFTISPSIATLSVVQGNSAASTINVTAANGFVGSVTLTASGLPSGVTAAFTTNPTTSSSVVTFTASASATVGTATVNVTGTSGNLTASTTIALTVKAPQSFSIAPAAATLALTQGTSATDTVTVTPINGFTSAVSLSATRLPTGVTASFATNPATSSSVLTFTASASASVGTTNINITGTSGALSAATTIALTVNPAPGITLAPASPSVTVTRGGTTTTPITIAGSGGFVGTVALSAAITSSPTGAQSLPTVSFGATSPVTVTAAGGTATLSISTTAASTAELAHPSGPPAFWQIGGGTLACVFLIGIPSKGRRWRSLLGIFGLFFALVGGMTGCGGSSTSQPPTGNPGTTPGTYTVTVTATSATISATVPITVNVQ